MMYLIRFRYEAYCQGYEWVTEYSLVYAYSFKDAIAKVQSLYRYAKEFEDLTVD